MSTEVSKSLHRSLIISFVRILRNKREVKDSIFKDLYPYHKIGIYWVFFNLYVCIDT